MMVAWAKGGAIRMEEKKLTLEPFQGWYGPELVMD